MKRNRLPALILAAILIVSISLSATLAAKPPRTRLSVTITKPVDGLEVPYDVDACGEFSVMGTVLAERGDAGLVQTFVQYAIGEGSTDFNFVGDANIQIVTGAEHQDATLAKDQSYGVIWTLTGRAGTYEIRLFSEGETAKDGESDSRTVTLLGPPPPDPPTDCEAIDDEYVDPENPFGTSSGTFMDTYYEDGIYEILMEAPNSHGTKNPTDDTADLNWIYFFEGLNQARTDTTFEFVGHIELSGEYLDSGFLEWDDQDTAFYVQVKLFGAWKTIAAITNIGTDRDYSVDIPDDSSSILELRIVDNDRGPERKSPQISSLYIDMACIVFEPAFEYFIGESPFEIPIGVDNMRIGDIDFDGDTDVYFTYQTDESWLVKYYEYNDGVWTEEVIPDLTVQGWVQVEDVDSDGYDELLTLEILPNGEFWLGYHNNDGGLEEWTYHPIANLFEVMYTVVVADIDNDLENEVVACKSPCDGYELKYFDYNSLTDSWTEIGLRNFEYDYTQFEVADIDHDEHNEIVCFRRGDIAQVEESALKYFELDGTWIEHDIMNVDPGRCMTTGDVDNDGNAEIVLAQYRYPDRETYLKVYDYSSGVWEETLSYYLSETLGFPTAMDIADIDHNDNGDNELVIGLFDDGAGLCNISIRYFEYDAVSDAWTENLVTDPDMTVAALKIGDIDGDSQNEILVGLTTWYPDSVIAPELRYYKVYQVCQP